MNRRDVLATIGVVGFSGCLELPGGGSSTATDDPGAESGSPTSTDAPATETRSPTGTDAATTVASDEGAVQFGLTATEFDSRLEERTGGGERPRLVSGYTVDGESRFATVWVDDAGGEWEVRTGLTASEYQDRFDAFNEEGKRPVHVSGYGVGGEDLYAAVWEPQEGKKWWARHGLTGSQFQSDFDEYTSAGTRLTQVSGFGVGGEDLYAGVWVDVDGPDWQAYWGEYLDDFRGTFQSRTDEGYRPTLISGYAVGGVARFATVYVESTGESWAAHVDMTASDLADRLLEYGRQGLAVEHLSGYGVGGEARYAAVWSDA
jgi:hypothetical protein